MESLLDSIRVAVSAGASDLERARGAAACRTLAEHLQPAPDPDPPPGPPAPPMPPSPAPFVPASVAPPAPAPSNPFANLTADQILDLVIAKLRHTAGPAAAAPPPGAPLQIHLVPIPRGPR